MGSILVVDDEPCIREVCVQYLSMAGYQVDESASGEEALAALALNHYDLLILDLQMHGMNGLATFMRMRLVTPKVKAVVVSGAAAEFASELEVARQNGLVGVLRKPFTLQELRVLVESAFRGQMEAA
jgi:CheY-like chemotaxis protein